MLELLITTADIDHLFGITDAEHNKELGR